MYINKVVFVEWEDLRNLTEEMEKLLVSDTDYDTHEILADTIQNIEEEINTRLNNGDNLGFTVKEFKENVQEAIGTDLYTLLEKGEVDFCLVV